MRRWSLDTVHVSVSRARREERGAAGAVGRSDEAGSRRKAPTGPSATLLMESTSMEGAMKGEYVRADSRADALGALAAVH